MSDNITACDISNFIVKNTYKCWIEITREALRDIIHLKDASGRRIVYVRFDGPPVICGVEYIINDEARGMQLFHKNLDGTIDIKTMKGLRNKGSRISDSAMVNVPNKSVADNFVAECKREILARAKRHSRRDWKIARKLIAKPK